MVNNVSLPSHSLTYWWCRQDNYWIRTRYLSLGRKTLKAALVSLVASANDWANSMSFLFSSLVTTIFEADFLLKTALHLRAVEVWSVSFCVCVYLLYRNILLFNLLLFLGVRFIYSKEPLFTDTSSKVGSSGAFIAWVWVEPASIQTWYRLWFGLLKVT